MSPVKHRSNGLVQAAPAADRTANFKLLLSAPSSQHPLRKEAGATLMPPQAPGRHLLHGHTYFWTEGRLTLRLLRRPLRQEIAQRATQQLPHSWLPARAADRRWLIQPRLWSERQREESSTQQERRLLFNSGWPLPPLQSPHTQAISAVWHEHHHTQWARDMIWWVFSKEELERPRWWYQSVFPEFLMINLWRTWEKSSFKKNNLY